MKLSFNKFARFMMVVATAVMCFANVLNTSSVAYAAINPQINYQGKLTTSANVAVADGLYSMVFKLYTAPTGGSAIWTETDSGANEVQVTSGLFSIMLGSTTPFTGVSFNQPLYLGVTIESDSEMTPRKILGAVPAAFVADTVDGVSSEQLVRNDIQNATSSTGTFLNILQSGAGKIAEFFGAASQSVLSILSNGNVGIGTTTPGSKLSVAGSAYFGGNITATGTLAVTSTTTTGGLSVGSLSGLLWGTSGAVSAVSTSSLGLLGSGVASSTYVPYTGALSAVNLGSQTFTTTGQTSLGNASTTAFTSSGATYLATGGGNVGIGTTNPLSALNIANSGYLSIGNDVGHAINYTNTGINGRVSSSGARSFVTFNVANTQVEGATFTTTGNVGIGTTTPAASLQIGTGNLLSIGSGGTAKALIFDNVNAVSGVQMGNLSTGSSADFRFIVKDTTDHYLAFSQPGTGYSGNLFGIPRSTSDYIFNAGGTARHLTIGTAGATDVLLGTNDTERIRITSGGNVGIGTASPGNSRLSVVGTANGTDALVNIDNSAGTGRGLFINSNGTTNVGFMVQTPLSTDLNTGKVFSGNISGDAFARFMFYSDGKYGIGPGSADRDVFLSRSAANTFRISSDGSAGLAHLIVTGNVGIGSTSPSSKLSVSGNSYFGGNIIATGTLAVTSTTTTGGLSVGSLSGLLWGTSGAVSAVSTSSLGLLGSGVASSTYVPYTGALSAVNLGSQTFTTTGQTSLGNASTTAFTSSGATYLATGGGNVGIGTTNPGYKFVINDAVAPVLQFTRAGSSRGLIGGADYLFVAQSASHLGILATAGKLYLGTGSPGVPSPTMTIDTTGNVGIGTTTPGNKLHVYTIPLDPSLAVGTYNGVASFQGNSVGLEVGVANSSPFGVWLQSRAYNSATAQALNLNPLGGNVGIGTTAPGAKLSIYNSTPDYNGSGKPSTVLNLGAYVDTVGNEGPAIDFNLRWLGGYEATDQNTGWVGARIAGVATVGTIGNLAFYTSTGASAAGGANSSEITEKMRILGNGNVGIGTTSPTNKLEVAGNGYFSGNLTAANITATGTADIAGDLTLGTNFNMTGIYSNFNIGGVTAMRGNGAGLLRIVDDKGFAFGTYTQYTIGKNSADDTLRIGRSTTPGSNNYIVLDSNGNVGIGSTTPSSRLTVSGDSYFGGNVIATGTLAVTSTTTTGGLSVGSLSGLLWGTSGAVSAVSTSSLGLAGTLIGTTGQIPYFNGTNSVVGTSSIFLASSGNVGVGTVSPSSKFEVFKNTYSGMRFDSIDTNDSRIILGNAGTAYESYLANNGYFGTLKLVNAGSGAVYLGHATAPTIYMSAGTGGSVGIGTVSPGNNLQISTSSSASSNVGITIANSGAGIGTGSRIQLGYSTADADSISLRGFYDTAGTTGIRARLDVGGTTTLTILNNGNVGIGTVTPGAKLDLVGTGVTDSNALIVTQTGNGVGMTLRGAASTDASTGRAFGILTTGEAYARSVFYNDGKFGVGSGSATRDVFLSRSAANTFRISSDGSTGSANLVVNGNVGIGTTSPSKILEVYSSGSMNEGLRLSQASGSQNFGLGIDNQGNQYGLGIYTNGTKIAVFENGGLIVGANYAIAANPVKAPTNGMIIEGNVGIGTTSPSNKLEVAGNGYFSGNLTAGNITATGTLNVSGATTLASSLSGLLWGTSGAVSAVSTSSLGLAGTLIGTTGQIPYFNGTNSVVGTSSIFLATSGNVGIGTVNPLYKLSINDTSPTINLGSTVANTGTTSLKFSFSGNSGLQEKVGIFAKATGSYGLANLYFAVNTAGDNSNVGINDARLTISSAGKVGTAVGTAFGVGILDAYDMLDVEGGGADTYLRINTGTSNISGIRLSHQTGATQQKTAILAPAQGSYGRSTGLYFSLNNVSDNTNADMSTVKMSILEGGNVGIGNTSPTYKLDINNGKTAGVTTIGANFFSANDWGLRVLGGSDNVTGGIGSGVVVGADGSSGMFGYDAGGGGASGLVFVTGTNSVPVEGLRITNTGTIGVGMTSPTQTLDMKAGGTYGYNGQILAQASTTKSNWFFGNAGNLTSTGSYNLAMGNQSLLNNTSGYNNVAFGGLQALVANTTGYNNTAIGYRAIFSNTSGNNNTANGSIAGATLVSGSNNTFLGYSADVSAAASTTLTNSTAIGSGAIVTASNQVVLGNTSVTQTLLNGNVGIGTTTSLGKLTIASASANRPVLVFGGTGTDQYRFSIGTELSDGTASNLALSPANGLVNIIRSGQNGKLSIYDSSGTTGIDLNSSGVSYITGSLGIGSTSPSSKLSVSGDAYFGGNITATGTLAVTSTTTTGGLSVGSLSGLLWGTSGAVSAVSTSSLGLASTLIGTTGQIPYFNGTNSVVGTSSIFLASSGNVGVGTAAPNTTLQLSGGEGATILSFLPTANSAPSTRGEIKFFGNSTNLNYFSSIQGLNNVNTNKNELAFTVNNSGTALEAMRIAYTGNVGIGTTSPSAKLSIRTDSSGSQNGLTITPGTASYFQSGIFQITDQNSVPKFRIGSGPGDGINSIIISGGTNGLNDTIISKIQNTSTYLSYLTRFDVERSGTSYTALEIDDGQGNTSPALRTYYGTQLAVTSGNVGVGTTTPSEKLSVSGNIFTTGTLTLGGSGVLSYSASNTSIPGHSVPGFSAGVRGYRGNVYGMDQTSLGTNTGISLYANSVEALTVRTSGNIGIGTTSPSNKLEVAGSGYFSGNLTAGNITATGTLTVGGTANFQDVVVNNDLSVGSYVFLGDGGSAQGQLSLNSGQTILEATNGLLLNSGTYYFNTAGAINASSITATATTTTEGLSVGSLSGLLWGTSGAVSAVSTSSLGLASTLIGTTGQIPYFNGTNSVVGTSSIFLAASGNVGIGTTGAGAKLQIDTPDTNTIGMYVKGQNGGQTANLAQWGWQADPTRTYITGTGALVSSQVITGGSLTPGSSFVIDNTKTMNTGIYGDNTSVFVSLVTSGQDRLYVNSSGNVGIGTTNSGGKLEINGGGANTTALLRSGNASNFTYWSLGRTADEFILGVAAASGQFFTGSGAFNAVAGDGIFKGQTGSTNRVLIGSGSGAATMVIDQPSVGVAINGNTTISGSVGIGTTSPSNKLEVAGNGYFSGNLTAGNITATGTLSVANASTTNLSVSGSLYNASLTSGRVPYISTAGRFIDSDKFTYNAAANQLVLDSDYSEGAIKIRNYTNTSNSGYLGIAGSTNQIITGSALGNFAIKSDSGMLFSADGGSNAHLSILSGGNVGIGTTTPGQLLTVDKNQNGATYAQVNNSNTGTAALGGFYATNSSGGISLTTLSTGYTTSQMFEANYGILATDTALAGMKIFTGGAGDPVIFGTNKTERMRIDGSGNVGIGTTTPGTKLSVAGDTYIGGNLTATGTLSVGTLSGVLWGTNGTVSAVSTSSLGLLGSGVASSTYVPYSGALSAVNLGSQTLTTTGQTSLGNASTTSFTSSGATYLATVSGNVGIGLGGTVPTEKLQVLGNIYLTAITPIIKANGADFTFDADNNGNDTGEYFRWTINNSGTEWMRLSNGNLGVNTASPSTYLNIVGTTDSGLTTHGLAQFGATNTTNITIDQNEIIARNNGAASELFLNADGGTVNVFNNTPGIFKVNTDDLYVTAGGNVGIGTTNPVGQLQVSSTTGASNVLIGNGAQGWGGVSFASNLASDAALFGQAGYTQIGVSSGGTIGMRVGNNTALGQFTMSNGLLTYTNGSVGIGTTSPSNKLEVAGNGYFSGNLTAANITATGTLSVTGKTTLVNASTTELTVTNKITAGTIAKSGGTSSQFLKADGTVDSTVYASTTALGSYVPYTGATTAVNLGSQTLTTTGKATFTNASTTAFTSTGATYLATASGNVGIGTVTPGSKLDVFGNAAIRYEDSSGTVTSIGTGSLAAGSAIALGEITSSGSGSIALGYASTFGSIVSSGSGSLAGGISDGGASFDVLSSGNGSFAWGSGIGATNSRSTAFGTGFTNSEANSFKIGYSSVPAFSVNVGGVVAGSPGGFSNTQVAPFEVLTSEANANEWATADKYFGDGVFGELRTGFDPLTAVAEIQGYNSGAPNSETAGPIVINRYGGNVGIGSSTPSSKLSVSGDAYIGGNLTATGTLAVSGHTSLATASTTNLSVSGSLYNASLTSGRVPYISTAGKFIDSDKFTYAATNQLVLDSDYSEGAIKIRNFSNTSNSGFLGVAGSTNQIITGSATGNFAIRSDAGMLFSANSGSTAHLSILSGGNVGVGITNPNTKLEVLGTASSTGLQVNGNGVFTGGLGVGAVNTVAGTLTTTGNATIGGDLDVAGGDITSANVVTSDADVALPHLVLDSSSAGDNWTSQGAYISIGESGALGTASMHLTYTGDGYGYSGAGTVTNGVPVSYWRYAYSGASILTTATVSIATLNLTNDLTVANGGTGASTLTGLLQGNGTSAVTGVTGTAGQIPYYNGTNTLLATSTIFLSNGNVGIGSTSPSSKLSVSGNTHIGGNLTTTGTLNVSGATTLASSLNGLLWGTSGAVSAVSTSSLGLLGSGAAAATYVPYTGATGDLNLGDNKVIAALGADLGGGADVGQINLWDVANSTNLQIYAGDNEIVFPNMYASTLALTSVLNVSGQTVLTNASTTNLSVSGSLYNAALTSGRVPYISTAGKFIDSANLTFDGTKLTTVNASTTALTSSGATYLATSGGNVGIGTAYPSYKLDVSSSAPIRLGIALLGAWPSYTGNAFFGNSTLDQTATGNYAILQSTSGATAINAATGQSITFGINGNTSSMIVNSSGNIGIGTASPSSKLSINGGLHVGGDSDAGDNNAIIDGTLTVAGQTSLANASTTNLTVSGQSFLGTVNGGTWNGSTIGVPYGGTGATTFTNNRLLTGNGTSALVDEANLTFDGTTMVVGGTGGLTVGGTDANYNGFALQKANAVLEINDTAGSANNKNWYFQASGGALYWGAVNDAFSSGTNYARILRSGSTITEWDLLYGLGSGGTTPLVVTPNNVAMINASSTNLTVSSNLFVTATSTTGSILPAGSYTNNISNFTLGSSGARWNQVWADTLNLGTSTWSLKTNGANRLGFFNASNGGGTEAMSFASNGNIGVGTTTNELDGIVSKLSIHNDISGQYITRFTSVDFPNQYLNAAVDYYGGEIGFSAGTLGGPSRLLIGYFRDNDTVGIVDNMIVASPATNELTLTANSYFDGNVSVTGNVGIGSTTPSAKLSVKGSGTGTGLLAQFTDSANIARFTVLDNGNVGVGIANPSVGFEVNHNVASFGVGSVGHVYISDDSYGGELGLMGDGDDVIAVKMLDGSYQYGGGTPGDGNLVVSSTGKVGIGTAAPLGSLQVGTVSGDWGSTAIPVQIHKASAAAGGSSGNLALFDTTTAGTGVGGGIIFGGNYSTTANTAEWAYIKGAKENATAGNYSSYLALGTRTSGSATAERLRIDSTGNVGIGTTTPSTKLDVNGQILAKGIMSYAPDAFGISGKAAILGGYISADPFIEAPGIGWVDTGTGAFTNALNSDGSAYFAGGLISLADGGSEQGQVSLNSGQTILGATNGLYLSSGTYYFNTAGAINASGLTVSGQTSLANASTTNLSISGNLTAGNITATGTLSLGSALTATNGGTGQSTVTTGDLLYGSASNVWSKLAGVATGNSLISGGVGTAPSWGKIGLTTHVSGTLPVANGGTGATTFTNNRLLTGNGTSALVDEANLTFDGTTLAISTSGQLKYASGYYDFLAPNTAGLRFILGSESVFQAYGGSHPSYAGQFYFDYAAGASAGGAAIWRNAYASWETVMRLDSNSNMGVGLATAPQAKIHIVETGFAQLRAGYSTTQYWEASTTPAGRTTFGAVGTTPSFSFNNNVGISSSTPFSKLTVGTGDIGAFNGAICADNGGNAKCFAALTAGVVYGDLGTFTASDLAENYAAANSNVEAGDIVMVTSLLSTTELQKRATDMIMLNKSSEDVTSVKDALNISVAKSNNPDKILGVISTKPGVLLGDTTGLDLQTKLTPVALSGRVPVKVNNEGGDIKMGDKITLSSVAGVGKKATTTDATVGIALEDFSGTSGKINLFVSLQSAYTNVASVVNPTVTMESNDNSSATNTNTPDTTVDVTTSTTTDSTGTTTTEGDVLTVDEVNAALGTLNDKVDTLSATVANISVASTSETLASSTPFITSVANAVSNVISSVGEWVVGKITATLAIFTEVKTEKLSVGSRAKPSGIVLYDEVNGNPYCLKIVNGAVSSSEGECTSESDSTTPITPVVPAENTSVVTNVATSTDAGTTTVTTVISDSTGDAGISATPATSSPTIATPEVDAEPATAVVPEVEPVSTATTEVSPEPSTESTPTHTPDAAAQASDPASDPAPAEVAESSPSSDPEPASDPAPTASADTSGSTNI